MLNYPCYVIHVKKGYEDRERSIVAQFGDLAQPFQWLLDYDIADLTPEIIDHYGYNGTKLRPSEISCSLKHIAAWERLVASQAPGAFILEDDAIIDRSRFLPVAAAALAEFPVNEAAGCLSLGDGYGLYVPWTKLKRGRYLYPAEQMRASDCYFLTRSAALNMLELIRQEGFYLPADHLINRLCHQLDIPILWVAPTLATQGSHSGLFSSMIQTEVKGGRLAQLLWAVKKLRRKYLYPLFGGDQRKLSPELRVDLKITRGGARL